MQPPKILFGTGVSAAKDYSSMKKLVKTALQYGITGFDAAPSYGSEELLGNVLEELQKDLSINRNQFFIQTKIDPWQMQLGFENIQSMVIETLKKMKLNYFDSLLIHWPIPEYFIETWSCLESLKREDVVRYIGISNLRKRQLEKYASIGISPDIIQIERNPLNICADEVDYCSKNNIILQGYSPLCKMNKKISDNKYLKDLSDKYNKSIGQIVLRYHLDSGICPVFTSKKVDRVSEYACIFDFKLEDFEVTKIDELNENYKMYLESWSCPGF